MWYKNSVSWLRRDSLNGDIRTSICSTNWSMINFYIAQIFKYFTVLRSKTKEYLFILIFQYCKNAV